MLACTLPRDVLAHRAFISLAQTCSIAPIHAPFLHPARSGHRALPFPGPAQSRSHRRPAIMFCFSTTPLPPTPHPHVLPFTTSPPPTHTHTHIHKHIHTRLPGPGSSVPAAGCGGLRPPKEGPPWQAILHPCFRSHPQEWGESATGGGRRWRICVPVPPAPRSRREQPRQWDAPFSCPAKPTR